MYVTNAERVIIRQTGYDYTNRDKLYVARGCVSV